MYFIYLFLLTIFLFFTFKIFKKEIFSPPVTMTLMFLFCSLILLGKYIDWSLTEYSIYTIQVIFIGLTTFVLGGLFAKKIATKFVFSKKLIIKSNIKNRIEIPIFLSTICLFLGVLDIFLLIKRIKMVVTIMNYNHSTFPKMLYSYRYLFIHNLIPKELRQSIYINLLNYSIEVFSVFALYIFLHNIIICKFKKIDFFQLAIVLIYPIYSLLVSSRGNIITLLAESIYLIYFFYGVKYGFSMKLEIKVLKKGMKIFVIFLFGFVLFSMFQNRINAKNPLINTLIIYISGGIRGIDLFLKNPIKSGQGIIGNDETLRYFSTFLSVHLGQGIKTLLPLEFREVNGLRIGNIYTAFRRYYSDFKIYGVVIFSGVLGYIMTFLYEKARKMCKYGKNSYSLILFAYLSKPIFYMAIEDYFFVSNVSINGLYKIILLYFLYVIFISNNFKRKK